MGNPPKVEELERELAALREEYRESQDAATMNRISRRFSEIDELLRELGGSTHGTEAISSMSARDDSSPSKRDAIAEFEALLARPSPAVERALKALDDRHSPSNGTSHAPAKPSEKLSKSPLDLLEEMLAAPSSFSSRDKSSRTSQREKPEAEVSKSAPSLNTDSPASSEPEPDAPFAHAVDEDIPTPDLIEDSEEDIPVADFPEEPLAPLEPPPAPLDSDTDDEGTAPSFDGDWLGSPLERLPTPISDTPFARRTPSPDLNHLDEIEDEHAESPLQEDPDAVIETAKHSLSSALAHVRESVINLETPPTKPDSTPRKSTPTVLNECLSDKMPNSISEAMPKFESGPEIRTCSRCGHGTPLEHEKCAKCGAVDLSLGVLDYVIAGDVNKVEQILKARPQVIATRTSKHGWTLLHMAASGGNSRMAEILLERGVDVDMPNSQGKTALHYAAGKGHVKVVETLIRYGADSTVKYNGKTPLDLARRAGHEEIVAQLTEAAARR